MSETPVPPPAEEEAGFDARLERLEGLIQELEEGGLGLEECLGRYREGVALLAGCKRQLDGFRQQVEELTREAEASLQPYEADPDA